MNRYILCRDFYLPIVLRNVENDFFLKGISNSCQYERDIEYCIENNLINLIGLDEFISQNDKTNGLSLNKRSNIIKNKKFSAYLF